MNNEGSFSLKAYSNFGNRFFEFHPTRVKKDDISISTIPNPSVAGDFEGFSV
jgi:hypothetical protein